MSLQWVTCGCDLQMVDLPSLCGSTEEWISDIFWIHWIRVKSDQVIPGQKEKMHKQGERKTTWPNTKSRRPWTAKTARKAANKTHSEFIYIYISTYLQRGDMLLTIDQSICGPLGPRF